MGQPSTASEYLQQASIQKQIQAVDKACDKALKDARALMSGPLKSVIPAKILTQHKADIVRAKTARGLFFKAQTYVLFEKVHDLQDVTPRYEEFIKAIDILERSNHRLAALLGAGVSLAAAAFITVFSRGDAEIKSRSKKLHARLLKLGKQLQRVKMNALGAKARASLHTVVAGVVFAMGPTSIIARVGVDIAGLTVNNTISWLLGPKGNSGYGPIKVPSTGPAKTLGALRPSLGKLTAMCNFGITVWKDLAVIDKAELDVKKVQAEIKAVTGELRDLVLAAEQMEREVQKKKDLLETSIKAFRASARQFKSSHDKRRPGKGIQTLVIRGAYRCRAPFRLVRITGSRARNIWRAAPRGRRWSRERNPPCRGGGTR